MESSLQMTNSARYVKPIAGATTLREAASL